MLIGSNDLILYSYVILRVRILNIKTVM